MSLAIEAAELMEHFQWISAEESRRATRDADRLAAVGDELADVVCYALAMANELGLDLSTAIRGKIAKNERKYPAEEYRGRYGPEDTGKETGPVRAGKEGGTAKGKGPKRKPRGV